MAFLSLIWITALVMIGLALCWMSGLILMRLVHARAAARRAKDRAAVVTGLSAILQGDLAGADLLAPYGDRARLMAEALLEFQALVRGSEQEQLLEVLRRKGLVEILAQRLRRGSLAGRLASLEALAALGGEEALAAMRRAASDAGPEMRMAAIKGLADSGAPPSVGRLLDYAVSGELPASRLYAEVLRKVVGADPQAAAAALARTDLPPSLRGLLLEALGRAGDYAILPSLIEAADSPEVEVRIAAIRALGALQHPAGEAAISRAVADEQWIVRSAAAEAAGASGFERLGEALDHLLGDPEWWVRFRAGEALLKLGREGVERLRAAAASERPLAQRAAELALAERNPA